VSTRFRFTTSLYGEESEAERRAHCLRSLKMTVLTFLVGLTFFALFFGLVLAVGQF
jgi:hypothetical protein